MADKKISELDAASSVSGTDEFEVNQSGTSKKATASQVSTYVQSSLSYGTIATQDANNVTITGGSIDGTTLGASTPSTGAFTTLDASGAIDFSGSSLISVNQRSIENDSGGLIYNASALIIRTFSGGINLDIQMSGTVRWKFAGSDYGFYAANATGGSQGADTINTKGYYLDGVSLDSIYQPLDAGLTSISGLTTTADRMIYTTASDTYAVTPLTSFARTLLDDTTSTAARTTLGAQAQDDFLDDIAALTDPNDDRILFWDDSAGALTWLDIGTNLSISGTTLNATAGGGGDVTGPVSSTDNAIARFDGTGGDTIQNSAVTIDDSGNVSANSMSLTTDLEVTHGGTGRSSHTAYAVICGGTTTTGAQQSVASVGTSGQVLTSNGAGALPTFQDAAGGGGYDVIDYQSFSAVTSVSSADSSWSDYASILVYYSATHSSNSYPYVRFSTNSGVSYATSGYNFHTRQYATTSDSETVYRNTTDRIGFVNTNTGGPSHIVMEILSPSVASTTSATYRGMISTSYMVNGNGYYSSGGVDGIQFIREGS